MQITIERRYQYFGKNGIQWTKWFDLKSFHSENDALENLKQLKDTKEANKKLKGEYRIKGEQ